MNKKLSIVISVYNEEAVLTQFFSHFKEIRTGLNWDYELIFVNDGSVDKSWDIIQDFAKEDENVKALGFSRNFGHEAAMIAGIDNASGDGIVCMDADLQHPLECLKDIIDKLEEGYDVINMVRLENKSAGIFKNLTSKLFYKMVNHLSEQTSFAENASDFFAVSAKAAKVLRENYREKVRFLRGYVQNIGFKKTTIEYKAAARVGGKSHYSFSQLMRMSTSAILSFSNLPLKTGIYAGLLSGGLGLIVLIYTLCTYHNAPSGYATIVVLICFLFAMLFVVVGIIGEYLAVIFSEMKDRPIYIIDEKVNFQSEKLND